MAKEITYYRHVVRGEPSVRPEQAAAPVYRAINRYRFSGHPVTHPWAESHDFSRVRAIARPASIQWPSLFAAVVEDRDCGTPVVTLGSPVVQFRVGVGYQFRGR
jgi:hypothetical protein